MRSYPRQRPSNHRKPQPVTKTQLKPRRKRQLHSVKAQTKKGIHAPAAPVLGTRLEKLLLSMSGERQAFVCSLMGLMVKFGLIALSGVSLCRLAGAYQERMERQGEIAAVLELENNQMTKARKRFDQLFAVAGEQRLIREQGQWIAPNRLRVVWQDSKYVAAAASPQHGGEAAAKPQTQP